MKSSFQPKFSAPSQSIGSTKLKPPKKTCMEKKSSLSDEQYDDLFASVLSRAAAGNITAAVSGKGHSPAEAAEGFTERIQNLSPLTVQAVNEVTPNTSPPEENNKLPKQNLLKPIKEKQQKPENSYHKRKSLEYKSSTNKGKLHSKEGHKPSREPKKKFLMKGMWVQCGAEDCLKWRFLSNCVDPSLLPEYWTCALNTDTEQNSCSAPEADWTSCIANSQDHFVYTEYNAGSIVWAKMPGYPPWPAMVDSDPDYNMFYEYDDQGIVLRYHVVFLDDNVSRAWIPSRFVESYTKKPFKLKDKTQEYKEELQVAVSVADAAIQMSLEERLQKYGFEKRFDLKRGKKGDWATKRFKTSRSKSQPRKPSKVRKKCSSPEKDHVVPQVSSDQCKSGDHCRAAEVPDQSTIDYWEHATEEMEISKSLHKNTRPQRDKSNKFAESTPSVKAGKKEKENKAPTDIKPDNPLPVPKPRKKPFFVAPSRSTTQQTQNILTHKSDTKTKGFDEKPSPCSVIRERLKLDPKIFSMEMSSAPALNECNPPKNPLISTDDLPSPILCGSEKGVESDQDEPIDLSLKCGSEPSLSPNAKSSKSSKISGKDFWVTQSTDKTKGKLDDPFLGGNIDEIRVNEEDERSGLMDEWEDCKLQQLDEWMPAISD